MLGASLLSYGQASRNSWDSRKTGQCAVCEYRPMIQGAHGPTSTSGSTDRRFRAYRRNQNLGPRLATKSPRRSSDGPSQTNTSRPTGTWSRRPLRRRPGPRRRTPMTEQPQARKRRRATVSLGRIGARFNGRGTDGDSRATFKSLSPCLGAAISKTSLSILCSLARVACLTLVLRLDAPRERPPEVLVCHHRARRSVDDRLARYHASDHQPDVQRHARRGQVWHVAGCADVPVA
jgi:hypothetical protein